MPGETATDPVCRNTKVPSKPLPLELKNHSRLYRWLRWSALLAGLLVTGLLAAAHLVDFSIDDEELDRIFANVPDPPRDLAVTTSGGVIRYVVLGNPLRPTVVFIHGTPGSWDNFARLMANRVLLDRAQLVALDRPGFGESQPGQAEPSLKRQAAAVATVVRAAAADGTALLVGHSLGAPIAARVAVDFPALTSGLVLVAPSIDPALEYLWWIQRPADWPFLAWLVPADLRTCNRELLPLRGELEELLPRWSGIRVPVTVIQGEDDSLVPAANADFAQRHLTQAPLVVKRIQGVDHFIPWTNPELITRAVLRHLDELEK